MPIIYRNTGQHSLRHIKGIRVNRREWMTCTLALLSAACADHTADVSPEEDEAAGKPLGERFSVFVPTPERAALRMLELARVGPNDLVLDLGSGDGRIALLAATRFGARGWGVDIDAARVDQSNAEAERRGLAGRVRFEHGDATLINPREASVVTLYLFPALINRLVPILLKHLRPGARIVTYEYTLADWPPEETLQTYVPERYLGFGGDAPIRLWVVPANFSGSWSGMIDVPVKLPLEINLNQRYQRINGFVSVGGRKHDISTTHVRGDEIEFSFDIDRAKYSLSARLVDGQLAGEALLKRGEKTTLRQWSAIRTGEPSRIDISP